MYTDPTGVRDVGGTENSSGDDADAHAHAQQILQSWHGFRNTSAPRTSFLLGPRKGRTYMYIYGYLIQLNRCWRRTSHFHHPVYDYDLVDGGNAAFLHINIRLRR